MTGFTPYQSKAIACLLTRAGAEDEALTQSLSAARVDLNPHQVDAALFALRSPLSRGAILADEVGLGKTIEAALVLAQRWWEGKRRLLLVVPASLRKQWAQELREKFSLRSTILDAKRVKDLLKEGKSRPFEADAIVIVSYEYAARMVAEVRRIAWDLVVFDEAHKLRNVYKAEPTSRAAVLRDALRERPKLLLTATPLQNNVMELYGLVSILDEHHFGTREGFRAEFDRPADERLLGVLGSRLAPICKRTLRRQVQKAGLINYTNRLARTFDFTPTKLEEDLYELVSEYLRDPETLAVGRNGRHLVTLVLRRILGSSSAAIAATLDKMVQRVKRQLAVDEGTLDDIDDIADRLDEQREAGDPAAADALEDESDDLLAGADPARLQAEIVRLERFRDLALSIGADAKADALVKALPAVLDEIEARGGKRKAVIFTESVRTQTGLAALLGKNGYDGQIVLLNGSNSDAASGAIYRAWLARHKGTDIVSGSKAADMKQAIVDAFRNDKTILIATESGAEGINLQFCSLVVNYDLPWNPQRVEQRIGRCHRYGQEIDVTVVNFLNRRNAAEARVFGLLNEKFRLFDGVFGASDEVLGAIESGVDVERRIYEIVQTCRTADEIDAAFDALQTELAVEIDDAKRAARERILTEMDDKVVQRLRVAKDAVVQQLDDHKRRLLALARAELPEARFHADHVERFDWDGRTWTTEWPLADEKGWQFFRLAEGKLASELVERAKARALPPAHVELRLADYDGKIAAADVLAGLSGWLRAAHLSLVTPAKVYDEVIFAALTDAGERVDPDVAARLMLVPAVELGGAADAPEDALVRLVEDERDRLASEAQERLGGYLEDESDKLDHWRADAQVSFDEQIKKLQKQAAEKTKQARATPGLADKLALQKEAAALKREADSLKKAYYQRLEEIDAERERLLDEVAAKLDLTPALEPLFTIRWTITA